MSLSNLKPRSDSAVVRNHITEIEGALSRGASREDVYEALKQEHELTLSFSAFVKALYRARAKAKETGSYKPEREAEQSGLHNPEPSEASTSETQDSQESTGKEEPEKRKKGPLKKGAFAPPKDFDPTQFDNRFTRGK